MTTNPYLVDVDELPEWGKDNPLIIHGYRRPGDPMYKGSAEKSAAGNSTAPLYCHDSAKHCWQSVWNYWHNETVNIHTHMWGSVFALFLLALHMCHLLGFIPWPDVMQKASTGDLPLGSNLSRIARVLPLSRSAPPGPHDIMGFFTFLASAAVCLGCSAVYHTMACHSYAVARSYNRLDYLGIVVLICGSGVPMLRYLFMCYPSIYYGYLTLSAVLGATALNLVLPTSSQSAAYRPIRTAVFIALGLCGVMPMLHAVALYEKQMVFETLGMRYVAISGALYIFGALLYVLRIPERYAPGRFDYVGSSHQIFHCFVLAGAWSHYIAVCRAYHFWHAVETLGGHVGEQAMCMLLHQH